MEIFDFLLKNTALIFAIIGVLAFVVSLITEVTKDIGFLKRIPTDAQVIVLSILLCQVSYFGYLSSFAKQFDWFLCFGAFIMAFIVAFVAMYGWNKLTTLYNRFKK